MWTSLYVNSMDAATQWLGAVHFAASDWDLVYKKQSYFGLVTCLYVRPGDGCRVWEFRRHNVSEYVRECLTDTWDVAPNFDNTRYDMELMIIGEPQIWRRDGKAVYYKLKPDVFVLVRDLELRFLWVWVCINPI
jgi:hypothetical protein